MVLIDLQKAFDTIDHDTFLAKIKCLGFSDDVIKWYKSYLSNRKFSVNIGQENSSVGYLNCGVPQGSILGPLIFLMYVNDMKIAVESCELLLYADDACLVYTDKNITNVETNLNTDFNSLCDWFIDNKLSIHLGEDKTKSIMFGKAKKVRQMRDMNIARGDINIKQYLSVNYLGCILDHDLSGKSMFSHVSGKISGRLKLLYRKQSFLSFQLRRLLCNALIQPHFDYASSAWYPNLNKKYKKKIQILQNKCIRFCLSLGNRQHIGYQEFKDINWLPTKQRYEQNVCTKVHNID